MSTRGTTQAKRQREIDKKERAVARAQRRDERKERRNSGAPADDGMPDPLVPVGIEAEPPVV